MEFFIENYFHLSEVNNWSCAIQSLQDGTVTIRVLPIPASRSRFHIELIDVIYFDLYAGWNGCLMNIATKEELQKFLPNLGTYLLSRISGEKIIEDYQLYVFVANGKNKYFVGRDAVIAKILP